MPIQDLDLSNTIYCAPPFESISPNENVAFEPGDHESESEVSTIVEFDHSSICTDPNCPTSGEREVQLQNDSPPLPISSPPLPISSPPLPISSPPISPLAPPPTPPLAPRSLPSPSVRAPDDSELLASQLVRRPPYRSRPQRSSTAARNFTVTGFRRRGPKAGC
ncbi:hypothetical protein TWF102_006980 [Orbilia oligospora]|uniref:Uncharacterized protein n=1 Tax=Orbilia oligospora TaxID=2813651 RepID=A0A7C8JCN8_ORBOL|nr:hypothetical protein TWF102_006980 [Orbilia oligospora]